MKILLTILLGGVLLAGVFFVGGARAATILIVNNDNPNEGFNDGTPAVPVGGNPGVTLGEQRLNCFQYAADIWGSLLPGDVTIRVGSSFDALACDAQSAVLGSAGPISIERDFAGAEWPGTWYHVSLANKQAGVDLEPTSDDIRARFNSAIDDNDNCMAGMNWYYGFDGIAGSDLALLPVLLHEIGHGLGFSTMVDESSGSEFDGLPDVFETFIYDNTVGLHWDEMTRAQRAVSATNTGNLAWDGPATTNAAANFLAGSSTMFVNYPATLPATITVAPAEFGPRLTDAGITGDLVLVIDGIAPENDGCSSLVNSAEINGNIALIDRGDCTFVSKAQQAEAAGAIAVVVADNVPGDTPIVMGGEDPGLTIPAVSVTMADGMDLKAELAGGVNVTLALNPDELEGADDLGRVLLYAPDPIQPGSSISHFDVSAFPNLLMEPMINPDLNEDVDLTLPSFEDIGWFDSGTTGAPPVPSAAGSSLEANYPNPFNPSTTIEFRVGVAGPVQLVVYDTAGRLVRTLVNRDLAVDAYAIAWDGRDNAGRSVGSGVYFYSLGTADYSQTRRMVLLR